MTNDDDGGDGRGHGENGNDNGGDGEGAGDGGSDGDARTFERRIRLSNISATPKLARCRF